MKYPHFYAPQPKRFILSILGLLALSTSALGAYRETMSPLGQSKNLRAHYGLIDDGAETNQSAIVQKAINELSKKGGGRLIMPQGTYKFASVYLKSNVHLLIEKGTVIKPDWPAGTTAVVFILDHEPGTSKNKKAFIENVSIRGLGGRWTIDYSDRKWTIGEGCRGVLGRMVRNFLIADLDVQDNFTVYCGLTMSPIRKSEDISDWEVSRATDGTIRNCRIFNASPGYGLVQLHGAQSLHFEDLYAKGGVTLRLETGAIGDHTAVFDISAKNIVGENGRCALMLGPHSANNGSVHVDGITARSCSYGVMMIKGNVKKSKAARNPEARPGRFADGSSIKNIRVIFGEHAQVKTHHILEIPKAYYSKLQIRQEGKFFDAPSIGGIRDHTNNTYRVDIENITLEGFTYNKKKKILKPEDTRPGKWFHELEKWQEIYANN